MCAAEARMRTPSMRAIKTKKVYCAPKMDYCSKMRSPHSAESASKDSLPHAGEKEALGRRARRGRGGLDELPQRSVKL